MYKHTAVSNDDRTDIISPYPYALSPVFQLITNFMPTYDIYDPQYPSSTSHGKVRQEISAQPGLPSTRGGSGGGGQAEHSDGDHLVRDLDSCAQTQGDRHTGELL